MSDEPKKLKEVVLRMEIKVDGKTYHVIEKVVHNESGDDTWKFLSEVEKWKKEQNAANFLYFARNHNEAT